MPLHRRVGIPFVLWIAMLALLCEVSAKCANSCSGHGQCGVGNVCICYDGWNGGAADCSSSKFVMILVHYRKSWNLQDLVQMGPPGLIRHMPPILLISLLNVPMLAFVIERLGCVNAVKDLPVVLVSEVSTIGRG